MFPHSFPSSPHTTSISVTVLRSSWSKKVHYRYDTIMKFSANKVFSPPSYIYIYIYMCVCVCVCVCVLPIHSQKDTLAPVYIFPWIVAPSDRKVHSVTFIRIWLDVVNIHYVVIILVICYHCPVIWGCRIHRLHLCRGVTPPPNECPDIDTKQSDGKIPVKFEFWGMRSTPL